MRRITDEDDLWGEPMPVVERYLEQKWKMSIKRAEATVETAWGLWNLPKPKDKDLMRAALVLASWAMYRRYLDELKKRKERRTKTK